ncbi:SDR family NAD(P)-dependent oxidoreductase [Streptomyces sp. NBC_00083]|uniref:SDR family NAD(P)-dependent oxidoreductase n=1 Tax=Streptomyces sp. NBC_00083 TaxID=2975647 RepID=UPI002258E5D2|nr:SDR family oxidoreductase [Streptomyces sp. NBC_00083]MCX5386874.1 SDR family oxidoreductase [Streptomyces sp. NBC_00083]
MASWRSEPGGDCGTHGLGGRRAIVTGAGSGIGAAVAQLLVERGAAVCVVDRSLRHLEPWGNAPVVRVAEDLSAVPSASRVVEAAERELGGIDILVHAAGVLKRTPFFEVDVDDWELHLRTNLRSTFFLAQECARVMRRQGSGGRIVALASDAWWTGGYDGSLAYAASKGGVVTLVRGIARELAPLRITVNAIVPGLVDTEMLRGQLSPDGLARQTAAVPWQRLADPSEIAQVVAFVVSGAAEYMTGAVLNVSGGLLTY